MSLVSSPYGLDPISSQEGFATRTLRIQKGIASGYATSIFKNGPVVILPATGTIAAVTNSTQAVFAVLDGVEYTPLGGRPTESPFWPAGMVVDPNYDFMVYVHPVQASTMRFRVQATGPIPQSGLGKEYNFSNFNAGNTVTGLSQLTLNPTPVGAGNNGQCTVVEFFDNTGIYGTIGDAFTDVIVTIDSTQLGYLSALSIG
jgi:hypothetical protein